MRLALCSIFRIPHSDFPLPIFPPSHLPNFFFSNFRIPTSHFSFHLLIFPPSHLLSSASHFQSSTFSSSQLLHFFPLPHSDFPLQFPPSHLLIFPPSVLRFPSSQLLIFSKSVFIRHNIGVNIICQQLVIGFPRQQNIKHVVYPARIETIFFQFNLFDFMGRRTFQVFIQS